MLNISKPLSASQAQTYHEKEFTAAEQNYWKQGDTIQGEWHGKLAEKFESVRCRGSGGVRPSLRRPAPADRQSSWSCIVPCMSTAMQTERWSLRSSIAPVGMRPFPLPSPSL